LVAFSFPPPQTAGGRAARPRHAEQQDRRLATEVGDVLDQVEEVRLAPVDVVEDDDDGPVAARCSSSFLKAQAISSGELDASSSPRSARARHAPRSAFSWIATSVTGSS
jgi:hypothetical protein